MSDFEQFGFEKEDIKGGVFEKFKGKKGETNRIGIIYTDPKAMFVGSKIHYKEKYFVCKKGKCCEILGPARWRVGAVIIKYSTDKQGTLKKPFAFDVYPWIFGEQTYNKLKNANSEFPLATHDLKVTCENEDYQTLTPTACSECVWISKDELKNMVLEQAKPMWDSLKRSIGQELSVEEINDLLGAPSAGGSDPSASIDLDSVLDKV